MVAVARKRHVISSPLTESLSRLVAESARSFKSKIDKFVSSLEAASGLQVLRLKEDYVNSKCLFSWEAGAAPTYIETAVAEAFDILPEDFTIQPLAKSFVHQYVDSKLLVIVCYASSTLYIEELRRGT